MSTTRLDPDELARLEEERDHLLGSLDDLEREHDAGDLDDVDYQALKDDYTVRAAEVLRAIDEHRSLLADQRPARNPWRTLGVVVVVLVLAVGAGLLVARTSGQRGGGTLTGNTGDRRAQLAACQPLAFSDPGKAIPCYQKILDEHPDDLDALTYQGWAYIRDEQIERGGRNLARVVELDPDYPDARVFRAIVLSRAGAFEEAAAEVDRFYRNDPPQDAVGVLQSQGLERTIFFGLQSDATTGCWRQAAQASPSEEAIDQGFLDDLRSCLEGVLATTPGDLDARLSHALSLIGPERQELDAALADVNLVLAAAPDDGNALALRASLHLARQELDLAEADLDRLDTLPRPTGAFLIGDPQQLRAALEAARDQSPASTTTTTRPQVSVSTVPGAPDIPNADGG